MRLTAYTAYMRAKEDLERKKEAYENECRQVALAGGKTLGLTKTNGDGGEDKCEFHKTILGNYVAFWLNADGQDGTEVSEDGAALLNRLETAGWKLDQLY